MTRWTPYALRLRLVALVAVAFSVLGALLAAHLLADREQDIEEAKRVLLAELRTITSRQETMVSRADGILNGLMDNPAVALNVPGKACDAQFAAVLRREREYVQAGLARPDGEVVCEASGARGTQLGDRAWFQAALGAGGLVAGDVVVSRIVGKPVIVLAKSLRDAQGRVLAVYFAGLNLDWMEQLLSESQRLGGARLSVIDGQGRLVARFPDPEKWAGTQVPAHIVSTLRRDAGPGTFVDVNRLGERRIVAHMPMMATSEDSRYHLLVSVSEQSVGAQARRDIVWSFGVLALVLLGTVAALVAGVHRWVLKPLGALADTVGRVRAGDLSARSGLPHGDDEIGLLARALDGSAAAIEDREQRLHNANHALRVLSAGNRTLLQLRSEESLLAQMVRAIVDAGGFGLAWIGYAAPGGAMRLMASAAAVGAPADTLAARADRLGSGPAARAMASRTPVVWKDGAGLPADDDWAACAREHGCRSALVLPLDVDGTVIGVLAICSPQRDVFDAGVIDVLTESSHDLALGIRVARAEVERAVVDEQLRRHRDELEGLVTERTAAVKRAMAEADAANRAKSAFLANMSHEIRTPMNAIIGLTHLMARDTRDAQQRERLGKVDAAAKHLLQVINDILDLSKIEAGKLVLEDVEFSRDELLANAFEMVTLAAEAKGIELILDTDHLPPRIRGDAKRLSQALINLLANAVKFTDQGWVRLKGELLAEDGDRLQLRFEVRDSGVGIPRDKQATLFQAFEQGDASFTRQYGGTGLGLALTKELAGLMGGSVGLESEPGQGSTFWFTAWVGRAASVQSATRDEDLIGLRALLVDDLPEALRALTTTLDLVGLRAEPCTSGAAAVALAGQELEAGRTFDVMLIDWRMPDMDGTETLQALRRLYGDGAPPSILVTAFNVDEMWRDARDAAFDAILVKPVTPSRLREVLHRVVARKPQTFEAQAPGEAEGNLRALHAGRRILLAEDNPVNQEVAQDLLDSVGLVVETAPDGQRAVEMATTRPYDLILMDVQMPTMDGLAATRQIRSRLGDAIPIVAMTANAFGDDRAACLAAGMNDHLGKPVDPPHLFATLLRWLPAAAQGGGASPGRSAPAEATRALQARLEAVAGFDLARALRNTGEQIAVLERILKRFVANYSEGVTELLDASGDAATRWHTAAHSLRGACMVVGASDLARQAGDLENALSGTPRLDDDLRAQARDLHEAVKGFSGDIAACLAPARG